MSVVVYKGFSVGERYLDSDTIARPCDVRCSMCMMCYSVVGVRSGDAPVIRQPLRRRS